MQVFCMTLWKYSPMTLEDLQAEFGEDVALLVDGVTKLTQSLLGW